MVRQTKQKNLVLEAINQLDHPSVQEIYDFVKKTYSSISMATVYRILAGYALEKKLLHIQIPNQADCYDYQIHQHYHLSCKKCKKVVDVSIPYMEKLNKEYDDCLIEDHDILFNGLCGNCKNKEGI